MISMFALGSDLPEIEVIRSALSEQRKFTVLPKYTDVLEALIHINLWGAGKLQARRFIETRRFHG